VIVAEIIEFLRCGGIKVWVLTGDKVDTAKNIGYSCKLLTQKGMDLLEYPKHYESLLQETQTLRLKQLQSKKKGLKVAYLITGEQLLLIESREIAGLFEEFSALAIDSDVVLCCRVSPKQKQEIVALVKSCVDC
jgi:magnesium-transporting ATPase (P-type)